MNEPGPFVPNPENPEDVSYFNRTRSSLYMWIFFFFGITSCLQGATQR
jgi:hypothetical protein